MTWMHRINSSNCRIKFYIRIVLNNSSSFSSMPLVIIPSIIKWNLIIKNCFCKFIFFTQFKKSSKSCFFWILSNFSRSFIRKVYSLTIFKMDCKLLDCWMPFMNRKSQNTPKCFIRSNVSS